jgi:hypothetical protein
MQTQAAGEAGRVSSPSAAARYIATLSNELAEIARHHRLDVLAHILEMARLEADQIAQSAADAGGRAA